MIRSIMSVLVFLLAVSFFSCDKCRDIACTTPPASLSFRLVHIPVPAKYMVEIINTRTKKSLPVIDNNGVYRISDIGWETGVENKDYRLVVNEVAYDFVYHTESESKDCCDLLGVLKEFSSDDLIIDKDGKDGVYVLTLKP